MKLILGDSLQKLKDLPTNTVDAVVTDAPYGLSKEPDARNVLRNWVEHDYAEITGKGFMGKEWDAFVPQPALWKEVIRVLKPGGHVLCFFGTRTYDWGVMSMRLAGFEVRDQVQWVFGSGFPKSQNVAIQIDKQAGVMGHRGKAFVTAGQDGREDLVGTRGVAIGGHEPITDEAKCWQGWGTALKPANEPIVLARKPLEKGLTVAQNVLKWNVGALNIDASRIGTKSAGETAWVYEEDRSGLHVNHVAGTVRLGGPATEVFSATSDVVQTSKEKELQAQDGTSKTATSCSHGLNQAAQNTSPIECNASNTGLSGESILAKSQTALLSTTKTKTGKTTASKTLNSCEGENTPSITLQSMQAAKNGMQNTQGAHASSVPLGRWPSNCLFDEEAAQALDEQSGVTKGGGKTTGKFTSKSGFGGGSISVDYADSGGASRFFYVAKASKRERNAGLGEDKCTHPTVKPIRLMEYLVRMVTPPGGIVLDPFMGSGTTGCAAVKLGYQFIGIEREAEYIEIARRRIEHWLAQAPDTEPDDDQLSFPEEPA